MLNSLLTLGLIVLAGWLSRKGKLLSAEDTKSLSVYVYHFGLPALFFSQLARLNLTSVDPWLVIGSVVPLILAFLILLALKTFRLLSKDLFVVLGISVLFGSNAFFGIPLFESLYGEWGLKVSVLTAALLGSFGVVASIALFEYATRQGKDLSFLWRVVKSPLILSVFLGLVASVFRIKITALFDALDILGKTASGTAIFLLGMFVRDHFSSGVLKGSLFYALFRMFLLPVVTYCVILAAQVDNPRVNAFLFLQSGVPAAVSIAIFAERYQYKVNELTGMVVLTSLMSFPALGFLYFLAEAF